MILMRGKSDRRSGTKAACLRNKQFLEPRRQRCRRDDGILMGMGMFDTATGEFEILKHGFMNHGTQGQRWSVGRYKLTCPCPLAEKGRSV